MDSHDRHALAWQMRAFQSLAHLARCAVREGKSQHTLWGDVALLDKMRHAPDQRGRFPRPWPGNHQGWSNCAGGFLLKMVQLGNDVSSAARLGLVISQDG